MMNLKVYGEKASITEYRTRPGLLSDLLPWAFLIKPGLGITKFGAFYQIIRFRGPDLESSTKAELVSTRAQINNALRRLGTGWCLHIESQRLSSTDYPDGSFPDEVSAMIDQERRIALRDKITHSFESDHYMTLMYLPPEDKISRAESLLYENLEEGSIEDAYRYQLRQFEQNVINVLNSLRSNMPFAELLGDDAIYTYLHSCVSDRHHPVMAPEIPQYMDAFLSDTPFKGGLDIELGRKKLSVIGIRSYPNRTLPLFLQGLDELPFEFRWSVRYMPLSHTEAEKTISQIKKKWFAKRKGMLTVFRESLFKEESKLEDSAALNKSDDADLALQVLGDGEVSFGFFTLNIVISDEDRTRLRGKTDEVLEKLNSKGFVAVEETTNAVDAWLGTIPAHPFANVRRPPVSSLNLTDLMPLAGTWAGDKINPHFSMPALLLAITAGSTPFRFNLHHGGVGHTMIAAPTGAGKSALMGFMAMQWRRYRNGRVIIFDREGSARCATQLVGGQFFPIGSESSGLSFQPLSDIDVEEERTWAVDWISDLCERERVVMSPRRKQELWEALTTLTKAGHPVSDRTLSVFRDMVQDQEIRDVLTMFVDGDGPHGDLLDADFAMEGSGDWQCYEMEALFKRPRAIGPVLTYLFHRLERQFDGRPTLLIIDEAWAALDQPEFKAKIDEWLRTLRRRNVSVVFASQDLQKIAESDISPVLIENTFTHIFGANRKAQDPKTRAAYDLFGLNARQIQLISRMIRQREYYYASSDGNRVFDLALSPLAIAVCGSSSRIDLNKMDEILREHGEAEFAWRWLDYKNIPREHIDRLRRDLKIHDGYAQTVADDGGEAVDIVDPSPDTPDDEAQTHQFQRLNA